MESADRLANPYVAPVVRAFRWAQWKMLFATMFCYVFFYTGRQTFGFAIPGIQAELGFSKQQLGWVSAAMLWSYAAGQAINGNLADKYGGRRAMTAGAVLSTIANWALSFMSGYLGILSCWGINGYFQALGWAPGSRLLSNWWGHNERGKLYGFYLFAAGSSAVMAYVTSTIVVDVLHLNWRWIFRVPVLLMLIGGLTFFLIVRDTPEEAGFESPHADNEKPITGISQNESKETSLGRYKAVFGNIRLTIAGISIGLANAARYGLIVWVPVRFFAEATVAGQAVTTGQRWISVALPVGMAFGAVSNGWVSDRFFGSKRSGAIALYMALATVTVLCMHQIPYSEVLLGMGTLFLCGFFVFGPQASFFALCPDLAGVKRAGTATGVLNFYSYLCAGLMEPFIGWLLDHHPDTGNIFLVVAVAAALSGIVALFIRR